MINNTNNVTVATINVTCFDIIYAGVDRIPDEGEELFAEVFAPQLGGGSPATLINAARLGLPVKIGTFLGKDIFSRLAGEEYRRLGVEPHNFYRGNGCPVMVTSAVSTRTDRTLISYAGEETNVEDQQAYDFLKGSRIVYMTGRNLPACRKLKQDGTILVYDAGWSEDLGMHNQQQYLELADFYTPNVREALKVTNASTPQQAVAVLSGYMKTPIVKIDADGALVIEDGVLYHVPQIAQFHRVDTTGAGDSFMSGLIYGIYHGYSVKESVLMGNITGGKSVTGVGCLSEFVTEAELLAMFRQYKNQIRVCG